MLSPGFIALKVYEHIAKKGPVAKLEVPAGQRGNELHLKFGGLGIGGMDTDGTLHIKVSAWNEFYDKISAFAYMAASPSLDIPTGKLAVTVIAFFDSNSHIG